MKHVFLVATLLSSSSLFAATNTANTPNVRKINSILFGDPEGGKVVKLNGTTSEGKKCLIQISASRFGTELSITVDKKPNKALTSYRVSVSAGTSSDFELKVKSSSLESSQVAFSADERGSEARKQTLSIDYSGRAPKTLSSVTITSIYGDKNDKGRWIFDEKDEKTTNCDVK